MGTAATPRRDRTLLLLGAITLLALGLRVVFFLGAEVRYPIRGDIVEYWNYAQNLVYHGVFSRAPVGDAVPAADAWRSPGYPAFLALCLKLAGSDLGAMRLVQWTQLVIGSLLAPLAFAMARRWLPTWAALAAAFAVAVWPHLVVFATTMLSETLFAFALGLAVVATARAHERGSAGLGAGAGALLGAATLVNPLLALFPWVLAAAMAWRRRTRVAVALLVAFVVVTAPWSLRNAGLGDAATASTRLQANLVQGSYPLLLDAVNDRFRNPIAADYLAHVVAEEKAMHADPRAGVEALLSRLAEQPAGYARWYLLRKPWDLWAWNIKIGSGDIYFLETEHSPYERLPVLVAMRAVAKALNPVVFALALLACLLAAWHARRRDVGIPAPPGADFAWLQLALLFAYVTALHAVLQAEPRYAVAYRAVELVLAMAALVALAGAVRARRPGRGQRPGDAGGYDPATPTKAPHPPA
jgi:4-amino-4-deoxy-L-arabinose transferase-like glycosyltransferase